MPSSARAYDCAGCLDTPSETYDLFPSKRLIVQEESALNPETLLPGAEWMVVRPLLSKAILGDPIAAIEAAHRIAERLNKYSKHECFWHGEVVPGEGLVFSTDRQGIGERYLIDAALLMRL